MIRLTKHVTSCCQEALTHGTLPWTVHGKTRTTLFYKYNARGSSWSADFFNPDEYARYPDMDRFKLSLFEPPNSRYNGRTTANSLTDAHPDLIKRNNDGVGRGGIAKL